MADQEGSPRPVMKRKQAKFFCKFNENWTKQKEFHGWLQKVDDSTARCKVCQIIFTVKHDGVGAVKRHLNSSCHVNRLKEISQNSTMETFFPQKSSPDSHRATISEVTQVYHTVKHHQSYLSLDCLMKLQPKIYGDSKIAKLVHCGRTKAEAILENVLFPSSLETVINDLKGVHDDYGVKPFSISTDASNKGNKKIFPVAVRYFDPSSGVKNKLLDVYEDSDESSDAISQKLLGHIEKAGLEMDNVVAYGADNASVNYGKHCSVFTKLKEKNPHLLKANCYCHILHNTGRHACKTLSYDVETLVIKIFNEFSCSAKKVAELKQCFEFVEQEYDTLLRHVCIRWLSLFPATERLLQCWPAVKVYFIKLGEDNCSKLVWKFLKDEEHTLNNDQILGGDTTIGECYLYFVHHVMNILHDAILKAESMNTYSSHLHDIMIETRNKFKDRIKDNFFGAKATKALKHLSSSNKNIFMKDALSVYERAVSYLEKWYDYENSPLKDLTVLNIKSTDELIYEDFLCAAKVLFALVDEDKLYDEVVLLRSVITTLDRKQTLDEQWASFFSGARAPNLYNIVSRMLAVPVSNAFVERTFSLMNNLWTDNRNRMRVALVRSELCVQVNYEMTCSQFCEFLSHKDQEPLLKAAMANTKYTLNK